jgi:hypothetical protein
MAVDIFRKRSAELISPVAEIEETVNVGVHIDDAEKVTFSGGTQGSAVIIDDPPILILTASKDKVGMFRVKFRLETPGREFSADGALRLVSGNNNKQVGIQIQREAPAEVTAVFYNDLKGKEKDQGSFELGIPPLSTNGELEPAIWHDPTILWEPPKG